MYMYMYIIIIREMHVYKSTLMNALQFLLDVCSAMHVEKKLVSKGVLLIIMLNPVKTMITKRSWIRKPSEKGTLHNV